MVNVEVPESENFEVLESQQEACTESDPVFTKWQEITLKQMGFVANLLLGLATAVLGFAAQKFEGFSTKDFEKHYNAAFLLRVLLLVALASLLVSILCGLRSASNRLHDFRATRDKVRLRGLHSRKEQWALQRKADIRMRQNLLGDDEERWQRDLRVKLDRFGKLTWSLYSYQSGAFFIGVFAIILYVALSKLLIG